MSVKLFASNPPVAVSATASVCSPARSKSDVSLGSESCP